MFVQSLVCINALLPTCLLCHIKNNLTMCYIKAKYKKKKLVALL